MGIRERLTIARCGRAGHIEEWWVEAIVIIASTMCCEMNIVEVVNREDFRGICAVGSFETGDIHVKDFVILQKAG